MGGKWISIKGVLKPDPKVEKNGAYLILAEKGVDHLGSEKKNEQVKNQLTALNKEFVNVDAGKKKE